MPILKVDGSIVRVGGKLVKYDTGKKWYAVVMSNYPEGERMAYGVIRELYAGAVTNPNLPYEDWASQEELEAAYGTYTIEDTQPDGRVAVLTHGTNYKDRVKNYFRTPGPNTPMEFTSRAAAIAHGMAQGYPAIPNRWDSAGANWTNVSGYSTLINPWFRHMYKETVKNWEWWSDASYAYAMEEVNLVCVNSAQEGWSQGTSSQGSYDMNLGDEENPNWITVYYGTLCCYEYLGFMSFADGVAEIGATPETIYPGYDQSFMPVMHFNVSSNYYAPGGPLGTTCPSPASHLVLTGQFHFIDSRGCALAPILESPVTIPASAVDYVIYDSNDTSIANGSISLNGGRGFSIRLNPNLESSIHSIKFVFTLNENDRSFNGYSYELKSVRINNTPTVKLDGTYSYTMLIPGASLGTIELLRRYVMKIPS